MQDFVLGGEAAGSGGTDTSTVFDNGREQATMVPLSAGRGVEMAALWLRLKRAAVGHSSSSRHLQGRVDDGQAENGGAGVGGGAPAFGFEGVVQVDLSCLGAGLFEKRDPTGSGCVSTAVFREVMERLDRPAGGQAFKCEHKEDI